jgi:hypothetical protein
MLVALVIDNGHFRKHYQTLFQAGIEEASIR